MSAASNSFWSSENSGVEARARARWSAPWRGRAGIPRGRRPAARGSPRSRAPGRSARRWSSRCWRGGRAPRRSGRRPRRDGRRCTARRPSASASTRRSAPGCTWTGSGARSSAVRPAAAGVGRWGWPRRFIGALFDVCASHSCQASALRAMSPARAHSDRRSAPRPVGCACDAAHAVRGRARGLPGELSHVPGARGDRRGGPLRRVGARGDRAARGVRAGRRAAASWRWPCPSATAAPAPRTSAST